MKKSCSPCFVMCYFPSAFLNSPQRNWQQMCLCGTKTTGRISEWKAVITWKCRETNAGGIWSIWELDRLINFPVVQRICWRPCKHSPPLRSMAFKGISCLFSYRLSLCGFIFYPESRKEKEADDNGTERKRKVRCEAQCGNVKKRKRLGRILSCNSVCVFLSNLLRNPLLCAALRSILLF